MKRLLLALALLVAAPRTPKLPSSKTTTRTAVARAKAKNVPIFVEAWAPW